MTVWLSGDLDMETSDVLVAAFDRIFATPSTHVVLDLTGLTFLDSTGVRVLLNGLAQARESGSALIVRCPQPLVDRVLRISGVAEHLGLPPRL